MKLQTTPLLAMALAAGPAFLSAPFRAPGPSGSSDPDLEARIAALQDTTSMMRRSGERLIIRGADLRIQNAVGATASTDGTGNLVIGYDVSGAGEGSHNIIVGDDHVYASYAGLVAGTRSLVSEPYAVAVGGGEPNLPGRAAIAEGAVVLGGQNTIARGPASAVIGGLGGETELLAEGSVALGGDSNTTTGSGSVIVGGFDNQCVGPRAAILGGTGHVITANGAEAVILGGADHQIDAPRAAILGGEAGMATAFETVIGGGTRASASLSRAIVLGGRDSSAVGSDAIVVGGLMNTAEGGVTVGGSENRSVGNSSVVTGGFNNSTTGTFATVSGGRDRPNNLLHGWRAGNLISNE